MENLNNEILMEGICVPDQFRDALKESHLKDLELRRQNLKDLRTLQKVIFIEESQELTLDEVLTRILSFYRKFVPYR